MWQRPKYIWRMYGFPCVSLLIKWLLWRIYRHCFNIWIYVALSDMVSPKMDCTMNKSGFRRRKWCSISGFYPHIFLNLFNNNISTACVRSNVLVLWIMKSEADTGGSQGGGLRPLEYRYGGFEPHWGHGCYFLVFVVRCGGSGPCDEPISRSEESYRLCVCVSDCVWSRNLNN